MAITPLPTPPSRDDPANFAARGDAFLGALPDFATEANALATQVNADANTASGAASSAAALVDATAWVSGTTYAQGDIVWSTINYLGYRRKTNGAGTTDPSLDTTNWIQATGTGNVLVDGSGTTGQLLTSQGAGVFPIWSDAPKTGNYGTDLIFEDYSFVTSSTPSSSGYLAYIHAVPLDENKEILVIHGDQSIHAVVWNSTTKTFGTPILVRTASLNNAPYIVNAVNVSSTSILVCSLPNNTTALQSVVLTVSDMTITVGTPLSTTLAATSVFIPNETSLIKVGSSYVLNYYTDSDSLPKFRALTVSGSSVSIGSQLAFAGGTGRYANFVHSSSMLVHFSSTSSNLYAYPITVSGTTLTGGTAATITITNASYVVGQLSTGRYALGYVATNGRGGVVTISGTTATNSQTSTSITATSPNWNMQVFGNQALLLTSTISAANFVVLTDTSGTASFGSSVSVGETGIRMLGTIANNKLLVGTVNAGDSKYSVIGISGADAIIEKTFISITSVGTPVTQTFSSDQYYTDTIAGAPNSGRSNGRPILKSATKIAPSYQQQYNFTISIDGSNYAKIQQSANYFASYNDGLSTAIAWGVGGGASGTDTTFRIRRVELL